MKKLSITTKLTLVFILFAGALLAGLSIPAYSKGRAALRVGTISELLATALEKQTTLDAWARNRQDAISEIANQPHFQDDITRFLNAAPDSSAADQAYADILMELHNWGGSGHRFLSLQVIEAQTGRVIASTTPLDEGKFREKEPYFINGKQAPTVQNPYYDLSLQGPIMTAAAPIFSADGSISAVLAGLLDMDEMNAIVQRRTGLHQSDDVFLLNASNLFVTQPRLISDPAILQQGVHTEAIDNCLLRNSGVVEADDYRGIPAIIVYRWLPERQLCLISKIDQQEAYAPARALGQTMALIGGLVLLAGSVVAFIMARTMTRPLHQLVRGAEQIGRGNFATRLEITSSDEIGSLGRAFNQMAANLTQSLGETARGQRMLLALSQAAQAVQRAPTSAEIYQAVGKTVSALGYHVMLFILSDDGRHLHIPFMTFDSAALRMVEKMVGLSAEDYHFPLVEGGHFQQILTEGETIYSLQTHEFVAETLPKAVQIAAGSITSLMKMDESILAPLRVGGEVIGLLNVTGTGLAETDVPAVSTFANQISIALENVQLYAETQYRLELEHLVAGISASFINLPIDQIDIGIEDALKKLAEFSGTVRASIFTLSDDLTIVTNTHEYCTDPADSQIQLLQGIPFEAFGYYRQKLLDIDNVVINTLSDLPLDTARGERQWIKEHGFRALLFVPLLYEGQLKGTLGFYGMLGEEIRWSEGFIELLRFAGDIIISALQRRQTDEELINHRDHLEELVSERSAALKQSEIMFRSAFDHAVVGRAMASPVGRFIRVNASLCEIFGYPEKEFLTKSWQDVTHPEYVGLSIQNISKLIEGQQPSFQMEEKVIHKQGHSVWIILNVVLIRDAQGQPLYMVGDIQDISDRKLAEGKLNQTLGDLARSNEELERFAYVASHDLQEPLRMVSSYLQLLERRYKDRLDSDAVEFINFAVDGALRMKALINDLLAYSRVGTRAKEFDTVACETSMENVLRNLQISIEETAAIITHDPLPEVLADEVQLEQLLQNLIGNAIKFHGEQAPEIHVGLEQKDAEWVFSVRDNGIGIDPQFFNRIFVIFQRLHDRTAYQGTGIGLAVSKRIVERHGGRIWVESQPGEGTTFYFTLPAIGENLS